MKKLIFPAFRSFLTIFVFISCTTIAFSQNCPPPTDPAIDGQCDPTPSTTSTTVSPLSEEFPDCKLDVTYKFIRCVKVDPNDPNKTITTFSVFDVEISDSSPGCEDLINKLGNTSIAGQEFLRRFNVSVGRQIQDDLASLVILKSGNSNSFSCTNGSAQKITNVDYYQSGCSSFVQGTIIREGKPKTIFRQVPCKSEKCCAFRRT
jgi:hypothetical protein